MACQLAVGRRAQPDPGTEVDGDANRETDERRHRHVRPALAEQRPFQLRVDAVEGRVVPVEPPARLAGAEEQVDQDGAEQRVVLGGAGARVGAGVDRGRRLSAELLEREQRVLARS